MTPTPYSPPAWAGALSLRPRQRVRLAHLPTPIEGWSPPGLADGARVWLLRDDLTGAALSGNKVRKLEFLLADALAAGCDMVLTCGGIQSNHARATAIAARRLGLEPMLFLRTAQPDSDPGLVGNLLLDRLVGATLRLITPEQYRERDALMAEEAERLRAAGRRPYVIPEGGSNALGSWGYLQAVGECLDTQAFRQSEITDVVVAVGSGGTAAGLALGLHLAGHAAKVHAVNVCDDAAYFHERIDTIFAELGTTARSRDLLDIMEGHVGLGYALSRDEELRHIAGVARATGVVLDPVYSGKAYCGLMKEWRQNRNRFKGDRVLFVHTGGIFGLYEKEAQWQALL